MDGQPPANPYLQSKPDNGIIAVLPIWLPVVRFVSKPKIVRVYFNFMQYAISNNPSNNSIN